MKIGSLKRLYLSGAHLEINMCQLKMHLESVFFHIKSILENIAYKKKTDIPIESFKYCGII